VVWDSGIAPVELRTIRRQDPALARNQSERAHIKQYRKAVEAAAAGKLVESFKRLDQMGAIVACGLGEQADRLAEEYIRLAEQKSSAVVVSQTWAEVHRVNSRVRDALKSKGLLGANDVTVQVLEKSDLTNAQKRDVRFYPKDGVIMFNQKVRQTEPGASGKLLGIVKIGVLVEVNGKCVTVANKLLEKITVCLPREIPIAVGERLHLKANRTLATGARTTNGELVTVKTFRADGGIELADGRVLRKGFREFLPGYANGSDVSNSGHGVRYVPRSAKRDDICSVFVPMALSGLRFHVAEPFRSQRILPCGTSAGWISNFNFWKPSPKRLTNGRLVRNPYFVANWSVSNLMLMVRFVSAVNGSRWQMHPPTCGLPFTNIFVNWQKWNYPSGSGNWPPHVASKCLAFPCGIRNHDGDRVHGTETSR